MKTIHTKHAPAAIGPYSQAKQAGGFVFLSGQIGIDPTAGKIITSDIAGQTEQVCKNIKAILKKAETPMDNVVKNDLLPHRHERLCRLQRSLCKTLPGQTGKKLLRRQGSSRWRTLRNRSHCR